jgi:hypothetical protein
MVAKCDLGAILFCTRPSEPGERLCLRGKKNLCAVAQTRSAFNIRRKFYPNLFIHTVIRFPESLAPVSAPPAGYFPLSHC